MQVVKLLLNPDYKPGTALKKVIHTALDVVPLPAKVRQAAKACGGCAARAHGMDRAYRRIMGGTTPPAPPPRA